MRPKRSLATEGFCCFLMMFSPQKVKNIVTCLPAAAAPLAITKEASARSKSSLKTISVLPSAAPEGEGEAPQHAGAAAASPLLTVASTMPPCCSTPSSRAPVIRHHETTSRAKAWSVARIRSRPPTDKPS